MAELTRDLGVLTIYNALREEAASDHADGSIAAYVPTQAELSAAFSTLHGLKGRGFSVLNSYVM